MVYEFLKYLGLFVICVITQVLIFHVAFPIVFIYFIIRLPIYLGLQWVFILSFLLGLCVDIFSDTPGVNALASTLISAIRKPLYYAYVNKDDLTSRIIPCVSMMGIIDYAKYLISFVIIYCILAFTIEYFSFANVKSLVIMVGASGLFSFVILLAIDCLIPNKAFG